MSDRTSNQLLGNPVPGEDRTPVKMAHTLIRLGRGDLTHVRATRDAFLQRHFYSTPQVARLLGVSERLVQAMAAPEETTCRSASGEVIVIGLRSIQHKGHRFPKADIDRFVSSSRPVSRS